LKNYGLAEGCLGDVVLVEAETVAQAVVDRPCRKLVVKGGQVVARNGIALLEAP
jgi:cytosine deaminase